ncbi:ADP-ribosylglycohydrolase family protein [Lichenibacterium minor]|uniref:ADP-ribosylglycohydrolase family protein n=1 Tax=Lichenibacterium minor TaxID=2316528 RepID=A0A4Q2U2G7_9HYPH|nr:ADP-ribosylglycohydrolase family protein [Lichenibacterium minor]RYC30350.1 ADP-ribosylglycohydrolase family protein [Lichenibacterium minor]
MNDTDSDKPGILDRARGALLGLAVGDALGSSLEFGPRVSPPLARREMTGGGPFNLPVGCWTDDTALSIGLGKSLVACRKFDPLDAAQRFLAYYREGEYSSVPGTCVDIGATTRQALERFERTGNPYSGSTDEHSSGNGSVMRLASVGIFTLDVPVEEAIRIAQAQSRLTHGSAVCLDGCSYLVQLLRLVLQGVEDPLVLALPRFEGHPDILRAKTALWGGVERRHVKPGGDCADTIHASLWSCANAPSFEHAVTLACNLGFDADTTACVAGAIAGAKFGAEAIPARWLEPLAQRHRIGTLALSLVRSSSDIYLYGA